jgi:hypothetical protein
MDLETGMRCRASKGKRMACPSIGDGPFWPMLNRSGSGNLLDGLVVGLCRRFCFESRIRIHLSKLNFVLLWVRSRRVILVAPPGLEPGLSALKGPRVNQLHHGAKHTTTSSPLQLYAVCFVETEEEKILVALPGLEPGLSALRGRRVNQLHHNARSHPQEAIFSSASTKYSKQKPRTQGIAIRGSVSV